MDRSLYLAMTGARQVLKAQAANSHNLSNASTTGFRAELQNFTSRPVNGPGLASRVYATADSAGIDLRSGQLVPTGRSLDVAVDGPGFLAVQREDGGEGYTRAGDLRVGTGGLLETANGHLVLGDAGPIAVPPAEDMAIGSDGTISVLPLGQPANARVVLDRIKLVNPPSTELVRAPNGLLTLRDGAPSPADAAVTLTSGSLESSNVSPAEALVKMVTLARQFELHTRMMKAAEDNDAASTRLMSLQ